MALIADQPTGVVLVKLYENTAGRWVQKFPDIVGDEKFAYECAVHYIVQNCSEEYQEKEISREEVQQEFPPDVTNNEESD